jgi:hypothetical protein
MVSAFKQRYRCQNPDDRAHSTVATTMPTWSCGAPMKNVYATPVFKELTDIRHLHG